MIRRKGLCIAGLTAALLLSGCGSKAEDNQEFVSHGENIYNGNTALIVDSEEEKRAELTMPPEETRVKLTIGVVKNDVSAITLANLADENESDKAIEKNEFIYADNYEALVNMLKDKQIGAAFMPPAKAIDIYAADKSIKVLASVTGKSYRLLGDNIASLSDLSGKSVYLSQDDKTSLYIITKLLSYAGVNDCKIEYAKDNAELTGMLKADQAEYAVLTEPYISILKQEGEAVGEYDFTQDWLNAAEGNSYSSGCLIATKEFIEQKKAVVDYMLADIERSVNAALNDADVSAANAAKYGLTDNQKAVESAYTAMDIGFYKDKQMHYLINNMFTAFGDDVQAPDEDFYRIKD